MILLKNISILLLFFPVFLFSQNKKIYLIDNNKKPITEFTISIYSNNKLININSNKKNFFLLPKKYDSIHINYDFFFDKTINNFSFKNIDTLILDKSVVLKPVILHHKEIEIGIKKIKRKLFISSGLQMLLRLNTEKYADYIIKNVKFYMYNRNKIGKFKKLRILDYNEMELILYASNSKDPNDKKENLLSQKYMVKLINLPKKGWYTVNLKNFNISIKKYKYLFVGFKVSGNTLFLGGFAKNVGKNSAVFLNDFYGIMPKTLKKTKWIESISSLNPGIIVTLEE